MDGKTAACPTIHMMMFLLGKNGFFLRKERELEPISFRLALSAGYVNVVLFIYLLIYFALGLLSF